MAETKSASEVAKVAGYSQYHAAGIVKAETGLSPFVSDGTDKFHKMSCIRAGRVSLGRFFVVH